MEVLSFGILDQAFEEGVSMILHLPVAPFLCSSSVDLLQDRVSPSGAAGTKKMDP